MRSGCRSAAYAIAWACAWLMPILGIGHAGAAEDEEASPASDYLLEEVLVTGQKITRDLQRTVDSVTVLSGEDLEEAGVDDLRDAFRLVPNVSYSPSNNGNNGLSIRGINSEGVGAPGGNQQPLSTVVIDGAAQSLEGMRKGARGTWDLESIEILRGPQITQGRNALAGAVIVNTRDPEHSFESAGRLVVDTQGHERAVMVNLPVTEQLAFRFAAEAIDKEKDIDYRDPQLAFLDDEDFYSFRTKLAFTPSALPGFSALFTWARAHDDPAITAVSGPDFFARRLDVAFDGIEQRINDVDNFVLDLGYVFDSGIELTAVSTLTMTAVQFSAPSPNFERDETRKDRDFSQDLRASYQSEDGRSALLVGGFYGHYRNRRDSVVSRLTPETIITEREVVIDADSCVNLNLTAAGNGRWYEFFSDAFAQIDRGFNGNQATDGFFLISASPGFSQIGGGADVFPAEGNWADVGTLLLDLSSFSGVGAETIPIAGASFDFDRYVADDDSLLNQGYATNVLVGSGAANFLDGTLTSLQAELDVVLTYDASAFGLGQMPWSGTLSLTPDGRFDLLVGDLGSTIGTIAYAWDFDGSYAASSAASCPSPGSRVTITEAVVTDRMIFATFQDLESESRRRNHAVYFEGEHRLAARTRLIGGLRYDVEEVRYEELNRLFEVRVAGEASYAALLPRLGLVYDLTGNVAIGVTASRGYRGGFLDRGRASAAQLTAVDPEFMWSYEVPVRSQWRNGRLRANANFFYYDWTDQQINVRDPVNPVLTLVRNAGRSEAYGAEFDVELRPLEALTINLSVGVLKTRFEDFETDVGDFTGNEFPEAPAATGALRVNYALPHGFHVGGDLSHKAEMFATSDLANQQALIIEGRNLVNLHAGYADPAGRFSLTAELENALDADYLTGRDINGGAYIGDALSAGVVVEAFF